MKRIPYFTTHTAAFLCGAFIASVTTAAAAPSITETYQKLRIFAQVLTHIELNYVDDINPENLVYDAIDGMLRHLEPHSTFMRAEHFRKLREDTAGTFGGIGIEADHLPQRGLRIVRISEDGPASHAGLVPGDLITKIDKSDVSAMHMEEILALLRGVPGTKVLLRVARRGWDKPRSIPLIRRHIRVHSVEARVTKENIGVIRITAFQQRTDFEVGEALMKFRRQMSQEKTEMRGLILDLRDNPGGLFDEAVKIADRFIRKGVIVTTKGRNKEHNEVDNAHPKGTEKDYPMLVLVNQGSASASEVVAGALQDHRRAKLIGTRTYGKGSVQSLFGLDDGSGLKLTIARYFTPSGRSIDKKGIHPDIRVPKGKVTGGDAPFERAVREIRGRSK